jgi:hypothetical protein
MNFVSKNDSFNSNICADNIKKWFAKIDVISLKCIEMSLYRHKRSQYSKIKGMRTISVDLSGLLDALK